MARIHGLVYLLTGIGVVVISWLVNMLKFRVFIYVGFVMIIVGAVKLFFSNVSAQQKHDIPRHLKQQQPHERQGKPSAHQLPPHEIKRCLRCTNVLNPNDRFCNKCGARVIR